MRLSFFIHPLEANMNLQRIFEKSENTAVVIFVAILVVGHYVLLRLIEAT